MERLTLNQLITDYDLAIQFYGLYHAQIKGQQGGMHWAEHNTAIQTIPNATVDFRRILDHEKIGFYYTIGRN